MRRDKFIARQDTSWGLAARAVYLQSSAPLFTEGVPIMQLRHLRLRDLSLGCALTVMLVASGLLAGANASELTPQQQAFREVYKELVEINTTDSVGDTVKSAEAMAARLRAGGIPAADIRVISSGPRKGNMVARLRGTGARKPILLIAHMDVVEAKREDWAFD